MHELTFRAHGNIVNILGAQLIDELSVAVLELVKNGYDADATRVEIKLENIFHSTDARVIVHDNGTGMTLGDIKDRWLVAGFSDKRERVLRHERTARGRFPLGRMGIGRFAAARLGNRLILVTRAAGHPELRLEIDWNAIAQAGDISVAPIEVIEQVEPMIFREKATGTRIAVLEPREPWRRSDVIALRNQLRRFISPHTAIPDFSVVFEVPEAPELENIEVFREEHSSHFFCEAIIESDGTGEFSWKDRLRKRELTEEVCFWNRVSREFREGRAKPVCGPLRVVLHAWKGTKAEIRKFGFNKPEHLDEIAGISIFRDGFRVLPYGDPGHDWLELNMRRVQDPSKRFSTNRILGSVSITTEDNPELNDQANRLGLIENQASADFRQLVLAVVSLLEERCLKGIVPDDQTAGPASNGSGRAGTRASEEDKKKAEQKGAAAETDGPPGTPTELSPTGEPGLHGGNPHSPPAPEEPRAPTGPDATALYLLTEAIDLLGRAKQAASLPAASRVIQQAQDLLTRAYELIHSGAEPADP